MKQEYLDAKITEHARRCPLRPAVKSEEGYITYRQLEERSNRIANFMNDRIEGEQNVIIILDRSAGLIEAIIGLLKRGLVFVPLNPVFPGNRMKIMIEESRAEWVITSVKYYEEFKDIIRGDGTGRGLKTLLIEGEDSDVEPGDNIFRLDPGIDGDGLVFERVYNENCYIYFTSGSTGIPKGILGRQSSLAHFIRWEMKEFDVDERFNVSQMTPPSFDPYLRDIFLPLMAGGVCCIPGNETLADMKALIDWIETNDITLIHTVPSLFKRLISQIEDPDCFRKLEYILLAGELLRGRDIYRFVELFKSRIQLVNVYGATETTLVKLFYRIQADDVNRSIIPVGKPIDGARVLILNDKREKCRRGKRGEIYIRTPFISSGYYNDPGLTGRVFIKNPYGKHARDIIYKTGDLGRQLPDGNIELSGRVDFQVKIRGGRVELGEIENRLLKHHAVSEAVVTAKEDEKGERYLCAYIVPVSDEEPGVPVLREYLSEDLPTYMIPSRFVFLRKMPLNSNGKIDRGALPEPGKETGERYIAPRNRLDEKLVAMWSDLLGIEKEKIGIDTDFFELGGHSLKMASLVSSIHKQMNVRVPLAAIFRKPTIKGIAEILSETEKEEHVAIKKAVEKPYYPLSTAQRRVFFLVQTGSIGATYNMAGAVKIKGPLDKAVVKRSFASLIDRHESFRTSFSYEKGQPVQRIHDVCQIVFEIERARARSRWGTQKDHREAKESSHEDKIYTNNSIGFRGQGSGINVGAGTRRVHPLRTARDPDPDAGQPQGLPLQDSSDTADIIQRFIRPFDLSQAPLLRVGLIEVEQEEHILLFDMHHIISDGTSVDVLVHEFVSLYSGKELEPLRIQYKDFSEWENRFMEGPVIEKQEKFWLEYLKGELPRLHMPLDFSRPEKQTFAGKEIFFTIPVEITEKLNILAREQEITLNILVLSIYFLLLTKYSDREDIIVGSLTAGRNHADLSNVIGMFANFLPIRNTAAAGQTFLEFLKTSARQIVSAYENRDYPFEKMIELSGTDSDISRNPVFDTMLIFHNQMERSLNLEIDDLIFSSCPLEKKAAALDFKLDIFPGVQGELSCILEFNTGLFKEETMKRFSVFFKRTVSAVLENNEIPLSRIDIVTPAEKKRVLQDFNDTAADYPHDKTIHRLFEEQAARTAHHIAVVGQLQTTHTAHVTYKELNRAAGRLAVILRQRGVEADTIVGIMTKRTIEMITGIFGILKAGGAYLPIDPGYPRARIDYMIADSGAALVINQKWPPRGRGHSRFGPHAWAGDKLLRSRHDNKLVLNKTFFRDGLGVGAGSKPALDSPGTDGQPQGLPLQSLTCGSPTCLAYVIYTSGTTGRPKGVGIEHHSLVNRLNWMQKQYPLNNCDIILHKTPFTFDVSVWEIFWWSIVGASVYLLEPGGEKDPSVIVRTIEKSGATVMHFVPSMLSLFLDYLTSSGSVNKISSLKQVIASGEALTPVQVNLFNKLIHARHNTRLGNLYGPTEATIDVTYFDCSTGEEFEKIPIGRPIDNTQLYVLDGHLNVRPVGVTGELCIGGVGLARGYLNRPELTHKKFINNQKFFGGSRGAAFQKSPPGRRRQRIYKTGDLARWLENGVIEFLGRIDQQVKIRGNRIELGEIERQLLSYEKVKEAVVVARERGNDKYLCGYIAVNPGEEAAVSQAELREYVSGRLPDYMVPSYFVQLDKIPLTPNGKVDRKALPEPLIETGVHYIAPRDEIEKKLVILWSEVLNVEKEKIGIDENFFHSGGHSLTAALLTGKIHKELNVNVPLNAVFKTPTIKGLAAYIKKEAPHYKYSSIKPVELKEYYPLSSAQRRLYVLQRMDEQGISYNIPLILNLEGEVDIEKMQGVFRRLINRHESLRTSFVIAAEEPVQKIHPTRVGHHVAGGSAASRGHHIADIDFKIEIRVGAALAAARGMRPDPDEGHGLEVPSLEGGPRSGRGGLVEIIKNFIQPFDLSEAPLFRVGLAACGSGEKRSHLLMIDMHHIISDGLSIGVLVKEFAHLYADENIAPLRLQYRDCCRWQNSKAQKELIREQEEYWMEQFFGEVPVLDLPLDYSRPAVQDFAGRTLDFEINKEETAALNSLAAQQGVTLFMLLLSLYTVFLSRLSGQEDIVVGTPAAGRGHSDLENIIGMFVNTLTLRNYPVMEKTFDLFLKEVKENTINAFENQDYLYEELVEKVNVQRDTGRNPLFDVMFALQRSATAPSYVTKRCSSQEKLHLRTRFSSDSSLDWSATAPSYVTKRCSSQEKLHLRTRFSSDSSLDWSATAPEPTPPASQPPLRRRGSARKPISVLSKSPLPWRGAPQGRGGLESSHDKELSNNSIPGLNISPYDHESRISKFDLTLTAFEIEDRLLFTFEYSTGLFKEETIRRFTRHFKRTVSAVLANYEIPLSRIEIITPEEKKQVLSDFNETETDYPHDKTIHRLFEEQAARTADHIAVVGQQQIKNSPRESQMTYKELDRAAGSLSVILRERGAGPGTIVGIMMGRSIELIISMLGILKTGAAYLPMDPEYPQERIDYMLKDSGTALLINQKFFRGPGGDFSKKPPGRRRRSPIVRHCHLPLQSLTDDSPGSAAYVIYTSGSTGKPKGVVIGHRAVNNFITGITREIPFKTGKTILAVTTICFDIHVLETLLPLTRGVRIVVADEQRQRDVGLLAGTIITHRVEMLQVTPSHMRMFLEDSHGRGAACLEQLEEIMVGGEPFPPEVLTGLKKVTPAGIYNMYGPTETTVWSSLEDLTSTEKITVGRPIANTQIYIFDKKAKPPTPRNTR